MDAVRLAPPARRLDLVAPQHRHRDPRLRPELRPQQGRAHRRGPRRAPARNRIRPRRSELYQDVQRYLAEDNPYIWLYHTQLAIVAQPNVVNVVNYELPPNAEGEELKGLPIQFGSHPLYQVWLRPTAVAAHPATRDVASACDERPSASWIWRSTPSRAGPARRPRPRRPRGRRVTVAGACPMPTPTTSPRSAGGDDQRSRAGGASPRRPIGLSRDRSSSTTSSSNRVASGSSSELRQLQLDAAAPDDRPARQAGIGDRHPPPADPARAWRSKRRRVTDVGDEGRPEVGQRLDARPPGATVDGWAATVTWGTKS